MISLAADAQLWNVENADRMATEWEVCEDKYEFVRYLSESVTSLANALESDGAGIDALTDGLDAIRLLYSSVRELPPQSKLTGWQSEVVAAFMNHGNVYARERVEEAVVQAMSFGQLVQRGLISEDTNVLLAHLITEVAHEVGQSLHPYRMDEAGPNKDVVSLEDLAEAYQKIALERLRAGRVIVRLANISLLRPILEEAYRFTSAKLTLALPEASVIFDRQILERSEAALAEPVLSECVMKLKLLGKILGEQPEEEG